jgi:ribonuclease T1
VTRACSAAPSAATGDVAVSSPAPARRGLGAVGAVLVVVLVAVLLWTGQGSEQAADPAPSTPSTGTPSTVTPSAGTDVDGETGLAWVRLEELPPEAAETVGLIEAGGPFPYRKDGATFGNFEGLLPDRPRGHYREYTVPTPGEDDRGARRIVTGSDDTVFFWTADHYDSFERIAR